MFRKIAIAATAVVALSAVVLAPTSASAWGRGWHHHHHGGYGYFGPALVATAIITSAAIAAERERCYVPAVVDTPRGPRRIYVNAC